MKLQVKVFLQNEFISLVIVSQKKSRQFIIVANSFSMSPITSNAPRVRDDFMITCHEIDS